MVSPFHKNGSVNSFPYENLSFLKMLQTRYNLPSSTIAAQRVNTVRDLTNSFAEPAVAAVTGDPVFAGFKGQQYQVHGVPGLVYNMLVAQDVLVNARFALIKEGDSMKWHSMKAARVQHERQRLRLLKQGSSMNVMNVSNSHPLPMTKSWTHTGTYLSELALLITDQKAPAQLFLRAGGYAFGMQQATLNGQPMQLGVEHVFNTQLGAVVVTLMTPHTVRLDHPWLTLTFVNSDGFFNLEGGQLLADAAVAGLDGLLGQTANEAWQPSASEQEREHLIFDYLVHEGEQGIFSSDFVKNRYATSQ